MPSMCPLWPFHLLAMYALVLFPMWLATCSATSYLVDNLPFSFHPEEVVMNLYDTKRIDINATKEFCDDSHSYSVVASNAANKIITYSDVHLRTTDDECLGFFNLTGISLGKHFVRVQNENGVLSDKLTFKVLRKERFIDKMFTYSVIILVSIIYINFGCALDMTALKETVKRPIAPAIGLCSQYLVMPLVSFGLGKWIFPESPEMQLGLFFTGISPGGGASNIWSVALDANVNLSVTMTTLSTLAAYAMFPFWLFALGHNIFVDADIATPYAKIGTYFLSLLVPLSIGVLSQRFLPRFAKVMVRILKPFSGFLIVFIVVFACVANTYLFQLFTWEIAAAGLGLPWLGYFFGFLISLALRQPMKDTLAIAIETGVQNTGLAIFMLRFALEAPAGDITTVLPVSVSIMTPIPLFLLFLYIRLRNRKTEKEENRIESMLERGNKPEPLLGIQ